MLFWSLSNCILVFFIAVHLSNGPIISFGTRTDLSANACYATLNPYLSHLFRWLDFWLIRLKRLKYYKRRKKKAKTKLVICLGWDVFWMGCHMMRKMLQWEFLLLYFLASLLTLVFVANGMIFFLFKYRNQICPHGRKIHLPAALQWILWEQWSSSFTGLGKTFTGFQGDRCRIM